MKRNKIYLEDCLVTLSKMDDSSIDLIVTSPPYNKNLYSKKLTKKERDYKVGSFRSIEYDNYDDNLPQEEYNKWQSDILTECCRVLKPTGSIFYNHIDILHHHNTIHPKFVYDFPVKQILIWNRKNTQKIDKSYFYPINEWVFWIKKSKDCKPKFNRKLATFQKNIIDLSPDTKNSHPAPFPESLVSNFILACTDEGDVVYDPFIGSGTTAIAAINNKRDYIGSEISEEYIEQSNLKIKGNCTQLKMF